MKHDRLKRIFSVLLCLCMMVSYLPTAASAAETACICTTVCTAESIDTDCPVCGVEGADLENCAQHSHTQEPEETTAPAETTEPSETTEPTVPEETIDEAAAAVQSMIDALPTPEECAAMDEEAQTAVYEAAQTAYDAYEALTPEQMEKIDLTKLVSLMDWFNGQTETLDDTTSSQPNVTTKDELKAALSNDDVTEIHITSNFNYNDSIVTTKKIVVAGGFTFKWQSDDGTLSANPLEIESGATLHVYNTASGAVQQSVQGTVINNGTIKTEKQYWGACEWTAQTTNNGTFTASDKTYFNYGNVPQNVTGGKINVAAVLGTEPTVTLPEWKCVGETITPTITGLISGCESDLSNIFKFQWKNGSNNEFNGETAVTPANGLSQLKLTISPKGNYVIRTGVNTKTGSIDSNVVRVFDRLNTAYVGSSGKDTYAGDNQNYPLATIQAAINRLTNNGRIILLTDITTSSPITGRTDITSCTLDLNGHNLSASNTIQVNAPLRITGSGNVSAIQFNDTGSKLYGGTYTQVAVPNGSVSSLLPEGYDFYQDDVKVEDTTSTPIENVTVKRSVPLTPVYVGGVQLKLGVNYVNDDSGSVKESTDESCNAIVTQDASGKYTLTINGLNVTGSSTITTPAYSNNQTAGISCYNAPLKIVVNGVSTVKGADVAEDSIGIYCNKALTINAPAQLTASGGISSKDNCCSSGIRCFDNLIISGTVTAIGGTSSNGYSYGVYGKPVIVNGANTVLTATGGSAKQISAGVNSSQMNTLNGGKVIAKAGTGNYAGYALQDYGFNTTVSGKKVKYATSEDGEATETRPSTAAYVIVTLGDPDPVYHKAIFYTDGGVLSGEGVTEVTKNQQYTMLYQEGVGMTLPTKDSVAKEGYVFTGWYLGGYSFGSIGASSTADMAFTAHWKRSITDADITLGQDPTYNAGEQTIAITSVTLDGETLTEGMDYRIKSGNTGTEAGTYTLTIEGMGIYTGTATKKWEICKAGQTAPVLSKTDETIRWKKDGKITGLTTDMEYSTSENGSYTSVTDPDMSFAAGTYYVRYAAKTNYSASPDTKVEIEEGRMLTITLPTESEQIGYTLTANSTEVQYNEGTVLRIILDSGYTRGDNFRVTATNGTITLVGGAYYLQNVTENTVVMVEGIVDSTAPTATITVKENSWRQFVDAITFGLFFKEKQDVTITAADAGSGVDKISYYLSDSALTLEQVKAIENWTEYTDAFSISAEQKYVVYAKVADNWGNTTYISSDGLVLDMTAPVISGVVNGKTYYTTQKVTANDTYLDSLTGTEADGIIPGDVDKVYTITAKDKAGNSTAFTITMKPISSICEGLPTVDTVKISDKAAIEAVKATTSDVLASQCANATDAEKAKLEQIITDCDALLKAIQNAVDAVKQIEVMPDAKNTQPDDKTAIDAYEAAKSAYDKLTENEKRMVGEDNKAKLDAMYKALTAYDITKGDGSTWTKGSTSGLTFTANGYFGKFTGIQIDGVTVDAKHYDAQSGSTVITLKASYLQTLKTGKHTIQVVYTDGATDGADTFTIKAAGTTGGNSTTNGVNSPGTGDHSNMALWIALLCVSAAGMATLLLVNRKRRSAK